jgi:hypothetical protein
MIPMRMMHGIKHGIFKNTEGWWIQYQLQTWNLIYEAYNKSRWVNIRFFTRHEAAEIYLRERGCMQISISVI